MEQTVIYLLMIQKFTNLKDSEIVTTPLCLETFHFSVDYDAIVVLIY